MPPWQNLVRRTFDQGSWTIALPTAGLLAMAIDTDKALNAMQHRLVGAIVVLVWACFAIAYLVRVSRPPRPGYLFSTEGIIDLLAAVSLPLGWLLGLEERDAHLLAIVWILKYYRQSTSLGLIGRVMRRASVSLLTVVTLFVAIFFLAATLAYLFEREKQPEAFGSVVRAMWWAIVTLTTTGYGDVTPATIWGRVLAGWLMVGGIVIFALWAGIIANAFSEELRRRHFLHTWELVAKVPFFRDLGAATTADIVRLLQPRDVAPGTVLMREGQVGDTMYFIVSGEVEVGVRPRPVRLGTGAFFGEMALLYGMRRSASVVVTEPSLLLVLDVADFRELAGRRPELVEAIEGEVKRRLAQNAAAEG